jgi:putative effector of murein hydrolase LrgA (UPF0299 family)
MDGTENTRSASTRSVLLWLLAALAFGYVLLRSAVLSFTYDETYTYLEHVRKNVFFLTEFDQMGGNHHLLNVWGMWFSERLFGNSEWALRLPSVLAFAGYLLAAVRISEHGANISLKLGAFILLVAHPYLLDFFSLARGYALGNAFLLLGLWAGLKHLRTKAWSDFMLACLFVALAALAHIVMVNFMLAFAGAWLVQLALDGQRTQPLWKPVVVLVAMVALPLLILLSNLLALHGAGSLNYGCDAFWSCSMASLMDQVIYRLPTPWGPLRWATLYVAAMLVVVLHSVITRWRTPTTEQRSVVLVGSILGLCLAAIWMQHAWFGVPLPRTRTGLYLLPLTALLLVVGLQAARTHTRWSSALAALLALPVTVHMVRAANLTHTVEWFSTGELNKAVDLIQTVVEQRPAQRERLTVRTCFETTGCMGYYIHARSLHALSFQQRSDTAFEPADLYMVEADAHHLVDTLNWQLVARWHTTDLALYRDERSLQPFTSLLHEEAFTNGDHATEVFPTISWTIPDTLPDPPYLLSGQIDALELRNTNWIGHILEVWRGGRLIAGLSVPSHHQTPVYGQWQRTGVELLVTTPLLPGDSVRYLAWPYIPSPPIELGPAVFRVLN